MTPFDITFDIDWTQLDEEQQKNFPPEVKERIEKIYFKGAAQWWKYAIKGFPPEVRLHRLEIEVKFKPIDREQGTVARVDRNKIVTVEGPNKALFPRKATMELDLDDIGRLLANRPGFLDTITHEIGHALGIGTLFEKQDGRDLVRCEGEGESERYFYKGLAGRRAYAALRRQPVEGIELPLVREKPSTTEAFHWTEQTLQFEIMSEWLDVPNATSTDTGINVISAVSIGALEDLGYLVEPLAARPLVLPPRKP